jgi:nicotinate dehydrogenase subunit A
MATTLQVNGKSCSVDASDNTLLLDVLRDSLGLKGTRFGCGQNQCGACHVLIDGKSQPACDMPLWAVAGRSVVTIEGLGQPDSPHPLQTAFLDEQAAQCGYCLSGIQMTAAELLAANPAPDESVVRSALDKHLCRCGSHNRIVRAVLRAATAMRAAKEGT